MRKEARCGNEFVEGGAKEKVFEDTWWVESLDEAVRYAQVDSAATIEALNRRRRRG